MTTGCDPHWTEEYEYRHMHAGLDQPQQPRLGTVMAKTKDMLPSNYLKQADFDQDYIVTVRKIEQKNIAMEGKPADMKWLAHFDEFDKPMVLNSTNIQLMEKATGSDDTDDWLGKEIIVYTDPNVSFGGELVGGLRIKKAQVAAPAKPKAAPKRAATYGDAPPDDDVPFDTDR